MKVRYLKKMPSRIGLIIPIRDLEDDEIGRHAYAPRRYRYYRFSEGYLKEAGTRRDPIFYNTWYSKDTILKGNAKHLSERLVEIIS